MTDPVALYISDPLVRRIVHHAAEAYGLPVSFAEQETMSALTVSMPVRLGTLLRNIHDLICTKQEVHLPALGRFLYDSRNAVLVHPGSDDEIILTEKEVMILDCLLQARGTLVSRRDLLTRVWGYAEGVETHTLETHIYRLRQKLEADPAQPSVLLTEEQGYSLKF